MGALVLVLNSGSSSIKYQLVDTADGHAVAGGLVERIGEDDGIITHSCGDEKREHTGPIANHEAGLALVFRMFGDSGQSLSTDVRAVGHRVVHGGAVFNEPTVITDEVVAEIERLSDLAPLHNPPNVVGIRSARALLPDVPQVAVFDTAFFHGLPAAAATYAIDRDVAERFGVRRYGFHGTSHDYVSAQAAAFLGRERSELNQIVLHLGNGASASAVRAGRAVDTTMGMTPLEGLVMGTRGGDIDPGVLLHLARHGGMGVDEIDTLLNRSSGLKGLSGVNDFRELGKRIDAGDEAAALAYEVYIHRLRHYIGAYLIELGHVDAITFTAGVGENAASVRADALAGLQGFGIEVDADRNLASSRVARRISPDDAPVAVLVVPTNEELAIARAAVAAAG